MIMALDQTLSLYLFILVQLLTVFNTAQWAIDDKGCRTPDGGVGDCVPVPACQPMIKFLTEAPKPMPQSTKDTLSLFTCGVTPKNKPKICCPSTPIVIKDMQKPIALNIETPSRLSTMIPAEPPDVSNHSNLALLSTDCGYINTGDRIVNGAKTALFEYPWMANLAYQTKAGIKFNCGGSVLNEKYILTAAHCVMNLRNKLVGVRVGEYDTSTKKDCEVEESGEEICADPVQDLAIDKIIAHPNYDNPHLANDLALIRVTPMNLSVENVKPICLPLENLRNYNFTKRFGIVTGWGRTETGRSSPVLMKAEIPVVPMEPCQKVYSSNNITINEQQICAGGKGGIDSCRGDSGGPFHFVGVLHGDVRYIQQGIVSFGPTNCEASGIPGVYTRIAYYMDWILDNIQP